MWIYSVICAYLDADTLHYDVDKWHQRAAEWRCASEALTESGNEDQEEGDEDLDDEQSQQWLDSNVLALEPEYLEMENKSTNTECVFVQTRHHKSANGPQSKSIVIKRSQTFSPSAVVNKNEYVCKVSVFLNRFNWIGNEWNESMEQL